MSKSEPVDILTPTGRIVGGHAFEGDSKDADGKDKTYKTGKKAGQPRIDWYLGIAILKTDPGWAAVWAAIHGVALASWPNQFDPSGNPISQKFAFKVTDGDSTMSNSKGNKPCDREGYPGHWILNVQQPSPLNCYAARANGQGYDTVVGPDARFDRGNFVRVNIRIVGNDSELNPGVYLNPNMVEFVAYGEKIMGSANPDTVLGNAPAAALPAGASATPLAPQNPPAAPVSAVPAAPMTAPTVPAPVMAPGTPPAPPTAPAAPIAIPGQAAFIAATGGPTPPPVTPPPATPAQPGVTPHPGFLNGPAAGQAPPAPTTQTAFSEIRHQAPDGVYTNLELSAAGYSPEQIAALPIVQ